MSVNSFKAMSLLQRKNLKLIKDYVVKSVEDKVASSSRQSRELYESFAKNLSAAFSTTTANSSEKPHLPEMEKKDKMQNSSGSDGKQLRVDEFNSMSSAIEKDHESSLLRPLVSNLPFWNTPDSEQEWKTKKTEEYSKTTIDARTRFVVSSLRVVDVSSSASVLMKLQEFSSHLFAFPQAKGLAVKSGAIGNLLRLRAQIDDEPIRAAIQEALSSVGYFDPVKGRGIRILSIDGGGTRGLMVIEMLRRFENITGKRIYELFDLICGVSTGAILAFLLGADKKSLDEVDAMYRNISNSVFTQSAIWGTSNLFWSHSYYDTATWEKFLKDAIGEGTQLKSCIDSDTPKVIAISAVVNRPNLFPYIFRSYNLPYKVQSQYMGSSSHPAWQAVRASAAAPSYFECFRIGDLLHQDGGMLVNNPCAIAIHEAKLLWPKSPLQCVISMGTGKFRPLNEKKDNSGNLSWRTQMGKIMDSATDTESVHVIMHDLLPGHVYHRFNPPVSDQLTLDEIRPEKFEMMLEDASMYCRRNRTKLERACETLLEARTPLQKAKDWVELKHTTWLQ